MSLVLRRGARTMTTVLDDGTWSIQLPRGTSPTDWGVEAWEILQRFCGSTLSEKTEDSDLTLLLACGADVLGYDETSISLANFSSNRMWVAVMCGALVILSPLAGSVCIIAMPEYGNLIALLGGAASMLAMVVMAGDGRATSVATFRKNGHEAVLFRRGVRRVFKILEGSIRVVSDTDGGEFVTVHPVFNCAPDAGTATILADFLKSYVVPGKPTTSTRET
jgi:hypothetical protein